MDGIGLSLPSENKMAQSLKQLKEENAKAEEEALTPPQEVEEETEVEAVAEETDELEEVAEPVEGEEEDAEIEDWMQSDEQTSQDADKKFTDSDVAAAKRKLRARLEKKDSELDALKAEIEALKSQAPKSAQAVGTKPVRSDFFGADDPDEAYLDALSDWKQENLKAEMLSATANKEAELRQQQMQQMTEKSVDQHYERAAQLAEKSGISAELYQSSDLQVRQAIESVMPGMGDAAADTLIASLGEGSERVFYNLGVNKSRLAELKNRLTEDPSGVRAAMYLGELKSELSPQRRKTSAPKPAPSLKGDEQVADKFASLKRKYNEAHKRGDTSAAFSARREARKAGADTTTW